MDNLKPGDIIMVRGNDWMSRIIEKVTRSKYSHCAIYIGNEKVIEAQGFRTVGYQSLSYYEDRYDVYRIDLPKIESGMAYLHSTIGMPYDYYDIMVLFFKLVFSLKLPWREAHRVICSRLARDFLFHSWIRIPDENMDPEDLVEWMVKNQGKQIAA